MTLLEHGRNLVSERLQALSAETECWPTGENILCQACRMLVKEYFTATGASTSFRKRALLPLYCSSLRLPHHLLHTGIPSASLRVVMVDFEISDVSRTLRYASAWPYICLRARELRHTSCLGVAI